MPSSLSSKTVHSLGGTRRRRAASRNVSGAGLPRPCTSSIVATASNRSSRFTANNVAFDDFAGSTGRDRHGDSAEITAGHIGDDFNLTKCVDPVPVGSVKLSQPEG